MILFFGTQSSKVYAVQTHASLSAKDISKLNWLFGNAQYLNKSALADFFIGPRAAMVSPWRTNAVQITQTMVIKGIKRIEEFLKVDSKFLEFDPMLSQKFAGFNADFFTVNVL